MFDMAAGSACFLSTPNVPQLNTRLTGRPILAVSNDGAERLRPLRDLDRYDGPTRQYSSTIPRRKLVNTKVVTRTKRVKLRYLKKKSIQNGRVVQWDGCGRT